MSTRQSIFAETKTHQSKSSKEESHSRLSTDLSYLSADCDSLRSCLNEYYLRYAHMHR